MSDDKSVPMVEDGETVAEINERLAHNLGVISEFLVGGSEDDWMAKEALEAATALRRQSKAVEIIQTMIEEMYAAQPTPRMKAFKAAIEAIYAS